MPALHNKRIIIIFLQTVLLAVLIFFPAGTVYSQEKKTGGVHGRIPESRWFTLESKHFHVHFNKGLKKLATRVADIAEDVHKKLSLSIKWRPSDKTHIIILDWYDRMNASATPLPRNVIKIYPVGPGLSELELMFTDDWLRMLVTHEYAHTLTLDMAGGVPGFFRKVFGRSLATVPTAYMPAWIHEGHAVYNESRFTGGGRIRGPYFDMILRAAVLDGKFNTLSQAQAGIDSWPLSTQYIYGAMFCRYLAERFGDDRLFEIFRRQSSVIGPFVPYMPGQFEMLLISLYWLAFDPVGKNGRRVFGGYPYERLWKSWHEKLEPHYKRQRADVEKKALTKPKRLTTTGYRTVEPEFSPDGKHIAYVSRGADRYTQLRLMDSDGKNDRLLYQGSIESLSWSPDGRKIVFAMFDYWKRLFLYSDLYTCEVESGRVRRLTFGLRAKTPAWSHDGKKILFSVNTGGGNSDLAVLDLERTKNQVTYFGQPKDFSVYSGCTWSPKGGKIAFVRLAPGSLQQIYLADTDGGRAKPVTNGMSQDFSPSWSPDGKYLLFTSNRTGIYNIFGYNLETGRIVQLTNVLGGALSPALSPDNKTLVYAAYSSDGWNIHTTQADLDKASEAGPSVNPLEKTGYGETTGEYKVRNYSAFQTIMPTAWSPFFYSSGEYGAMTAGADVLEKHTYTIQLGYNFHLHRPVMSLLYSYDGGKYKGEPVTGDIMASWHPALFTELMENAAQEYVDYWEEQRIVDLSLSANIWRSTETQVDLAFGYEYKRFDRISHLEPGGSVPGVGVLSSIYLSALYDNTKLYRLGISLCQQENIMFLWRVLSGVSVTGR
jgi:Tol biopolymer transport system component